MRTATTTVQPSAAGARPRAGERPRTVIRPTGRLWTGLHRQLAVLPDHVDLFYTLSAHRISVRYRQTVLGAAWAVIQPLLMMAIFTAVFSVLARMPSDGVPYPLFTYAALLPWTFFSSGLTNSTASLVNHTQLITKVYFPREILPATYIVAALFDFAIGFVVLNALLAWYGTTLTAQAVNLVPILLLLIAWLAAVALFTAALQVRWRDIGVAMPLVTQVWMFASPVVYPLSAVPAAWRPWYLLNPMAGIIESVRDVLLHGTPPDPVPLRYAVVVTACVLPLAYAFFKHAEATMADVI